METTQLDGTYRGRVIDGLLGQGKKEEDVELVLTCEVKVGEQSVRLAYRGYFTDKSTEHTLKALRIAGFKDLDMMSLYEEGAWAKAVPKPPDVEFVINQEPDMEYAEGSGELVQKYTPDGTPLTRARIRWINATGAIGVRTPLTQDKAKLFAAKMRAQLAALDAKTKQPKNNGAATRAPEPPPLTDSDGPPF